MAIVMGRVRVGVRDWDWTARSQHDDTSKCLLSRQRKTAQRGVCEELGKLDEIRETIINIKNTLSSTGRLPKTA